MMGSRKTIMTCLVAAFFLVGCATIVSHTQWPVNITSTPDQATVVITERDEGKIFEGKTPTIVTLKSGGGYFRSKEYTVNVSKEGFGTKTIVLKGDLNPWYLGNVIFGGLIGILIVDPLTGAMWKIQPDKVNIVLDQKSSKAGEGVHLAIMLLEDVPNELRDSMIKIK